MSYKNRKLEYLLFVILVESSFISRQKPAMQGVHVDHQYGCDEHNNEHFRPALQEIDNHLQLHWNVFGKVNEVFQSSFLC